MKLGNLERGLIMLTACTALAACRPVPLRSADLGRLPQADEALSSLRKHASQVASLQSLGRVTYFGKEGRIRLKAVLVAQRPTKFRIETLSPLEQPLQVMVSDGRRLRLLSEGQFYEGRSDAMNVSRILTLPLSPSDLVDALLGGVPMDDRFQAEGIEWADNSGERIRLRLHAKMTGARVMLEYDKSSQLVRLLQIPARSPQPEVIIEFEKIEALPAPLNLPLARRIKLRVPSEDHEVSLKLKEVAVNVGINPSTFSLSPPAGIEPIDLDFARTSSVSE